MTTNPGPARSSTVELILGRHLPRTSTPPRDPLHEIDQDRLIAELLPLVKRMALRIRHRLPPHIEVGDLVGAGSLGLLYAVRKFDARKRVKIETYARHRIRGAMLDSLRSLDCASRDMRRKTKKVEKAYEDLETKLGQPVGEAEVASELGIRLKEWHRTVRELRAVGLRRVGSMLPAVSSPCVEELLAENQENPFDRCYRLEQREILKRAIAGLPKRERQVISLYYEQPRTMKEVAEKLGIDQSRVSQIHSAVLVRLRRRVNVILRGAVPGFALSREAETGRNYNLI